MKRKFKRIASLVLAAIMVFAMAMPAMAAEGTTPKYSITIDEANPGHKYVGYQIFTGTLSKGDGAANPSGQVLSDVSWGDGIGEAGKTALYEKYYPAGKDNPNDKDNIYKLLKALEGKDAAEIAATIKPYLVEATTEMTFTENKSDEATLNYTLENLVAGYYMVVDEEADLAEGDAYSSYIVQVVGNTEMNPKSDAPSVEKKVMDINDSETTTAGTPQDSADYDIGDVVPFQLTGELPSNYSSYTIYKYVFNDHLSEGLSYVAESVKVYVVNSGVRSEITDGFSITAEPTTEPVGTDLKVSFANLKEATVKDDAVIDENSQIVVEYQATLNDKAVVGAGGNPNTVTLTYSNNPNPGGEGEGTTPPDKVVVFTYETDIDKVDEAGEPLEGAVFTLYKWMKGTRPADSPADDHTPTTYPGGESADTGYWKTLTAKVVDNTKFEFEGLDDGIYKLVETQTPVGRNTAPDIDFKITATHDERADEPKLLTFKIDTDSLTAGGATGAGVTAEKTKKDETETVAPGFVYGEVVNKEGATLPETGGIGTTIFYVVGSVLVLGAVILLVTKRRMKSE